MNSTELGQYIEATEGISKPWLLIQLRLLKLEENRNQLSENEYAENLQDIHEDLMNLGEWWIGIEDKVF